LVKCDGDPKANKTGTMISGGVVTNGHTYIFERVGLTVNTVLDVQMDLCTFYCLKGAANQGTTFCHGHKSLVRITCKL
jgi:hypothetical protein